MNTLGTGYRFDAIRRKQWSMYGLRTEINLCFLTWVGAQSKSGMRACQLSCVKSACFELLLPVALLALLQGRQ